MGCMDAWNSGRHAHGLPCKRLGLVRIDEKYESIRCTIMCNNHTDNTGDQDARSGSTVGETLGSVVQINVISLLISKDATTVSAFFSFALLCMA